MSKELFDQEPEKHESYGMLKISRVTSNPPKNLFGSSIRHGHYITLAICEGEKRRDFQKDWYSTRKQLIEVEMSATQFADAITSLNVGEGVPCTIHYVESDKDPESAKVRFREKCPEVNFKQLATKELKEEMGDLAKLLATLKKDAEEILNSKGTIKASEKKKLLADLRRIEQELSSNLPFVHECFNESVERTVVEAKGEIDATYQGMRERLGDEAIKHLNSSVIEVPMLEEGDKENG